MSKNASKLSENVQTLERYCKKTKKTYQKNAKIFLYNWDFPL
jgi:hypothetical protein